MSNHHQINYVEFPAYRLRKTKNFFETVFHWAFQDFGPDYSSFSSQGLDGGFYTTEHKPSLPPQAALIILFSKNLEKTLLQVKAAGGTISKDVFDFPGGRRFHFIEPSGNELAVWSNIT